MSKTISARIPNINHEEILERCNRTGCTINEWLNAGVDYLLTGSSNFDFGEESEVELIKPKPAVKYVDV